MRRRSPVVMVGSGEWRGRVLSYPDDPAVRPSMQRTRHSLFSSLGARVRGAVFADCYAGAGAVGIEALSLGAARVHFVETRRDAVAALRTNLAACRADPSRFVVHGVPVADVLEREPCPIGDAAIVFADPPYDADVEGEFLTRIRLARFRALECVVVEHRTKVAVHAPEGMRLERERRFGETTLTYFAPVA